MPLDLLNPDKAAFFGFSAADFDALAGSWGWPAFRAQQVRDWVYTKLIDRPGVMSNLSKSNRALLEQRLVFSNGQIVRHQNSADQTQKLLLAWDNANAETVMIPDGPRRTACVSSQVGCPVGCKFCASGVNGVKGNLTSAQIVEQVWNLNRLLAQDSGFALPPPLNPEPRTLNPHSSRISNVVFMGMGEPLANYANVMQAVRILHDPKCLNISARRITISTVGVPPKVRELAGEELPINLAISLHAPNEKLRRELIPWAEHFAMNEILDAARYYFEQTGREITLEYILLSGINDRPEHARELAKLCHTLRANVNLIRYNEVEGLPFRRPKSVDVVKFQDILRHNGVNAHVRKSRGRDIDAACGQLRRKQQASISA